MYCSITVSVRSKEVGPLTLGAIQRTLAPVPVKVPPVDVHWYVRFTGLVSRSCTTAVTSRAPLGSTRAFAVIDWMTGGVLVPAAVRNRKLLDHGSTTPAWVTRERQ